MQRDFANTQALRCIDGELGHQALDRLGAHIDLVRGGANQFKQDPMAQAARRQLHLVDLQQTEDRAQNAQTAADHGATVVLQTDQVQALCALCVDQFVL